jgi:UDP-N-acetylmuramyl pentapeptide phosphotransferase/UDP-N-acetylglucosamine-1-phosphate transferase
MPITELGNTATLYRVTPFLIIVPLAAFAISVALHALALRFFPSFGLMDFPERYGLTRKRLPYPTGILCVATFLVFLPVVRSIASQEIGLMVGLVLLGIVSFIDDRHPLPSWMRLGLQVLVCLVVFATGSRIYTITNPFDVFGIDVIKLDALTISYSCSSAILCSHGVLLS